VTYGNPFDKLDDHTKHDGKIVGRYICC